MIHFGDAVMGFGDLFVAATLGCLLAASQRRPAPCRGLLVAILALAFDLLFFALDTLPATVPVAVALWLVDRGDRRRRAGSEPPGLERPGDRS